MKKMFIIGTCLGAVAGVAAAQGLVVGLLNFKPINKQFKLKAGESLVIMANDAKVVEYTCPDGKTFQGSLNFNGSEQ